MRIGTRGSLLARRQSQLAADALKRLHPDLSIEWVVIQTTGDRIVDRPLYEQGGKGLFIRELELALLERRIDLAVHSYKDVPVTLPLVAQENLTIAAVPSRARPWDVLISRSARSLRDLPASARVGTGSLRRQVQLLTRHPSLQVVPIRGNIDTRLKKWADGEVDALILAQSGLERAELFDPAAMSILPPGTMLPAAGQGALALQCRADDEATRRTAAALNDRPTQQCVEAERALVEQLRGDCHSPIAALARITGDDPHQMRLQALVGGADADGRMKVIQADAVGRVPASLAREVHQQLQAQGAEALLGREA